MISFKQYIRLIHEGGGFGHLSHPFDIDDFTFKDLADIIDKSLSGELEWAREKTDGQNLLVTWKDGALRAARNGGHIKNFGEKSLTVSGIEAMFAGRGTVATAFTSAAQDLQDAFAKLTDKQKEKIFQNGKKFMSVEVIDANNPNVIKYGFSELRFHGTLEYDVDGNAIGQLNKEDGRILGGMIDQVRASRQTTFDIKSLPKLQMKKLPNYDALKAKFTSELKSIMKEYGMSSSNTIKDYIRAHWEQRVEDNFPSLNDQEKEMLVQRWAFFVKQPNIRQLKKMLPDVDIASFEKTHKDDYKQMQLKFEHLFLKLGVEVVKGMSTFLAVNPEFTNNTLKTDLDAVVKKASKSKDPAIAKKLAAELQRFSDIGGVDAVMPTEGITFFYKGELLKLTGTFAPINQLIGLMWKI